MTLLRLDIFHEPLFKEPAKIVRKIGQKQQIEVLDSTSPLLQKVIVPPQYAYISRTDYRKQRIRWESDFDFRPHLSEWREYYGDCGMRSTTFLDIQKALVERGYLKKINVKLKDFDVKTKKALAKHQKDKGLKIGVLDDETLKSLGLSTNYNKKQ